MKPLLKLGMCLLTAWNTTACSAPSIPPSEAVNFSRPVYTQDAAIVCPVAVVTDHIIPASAIRDLFEKTTDRRNRAKKIGCEEWSPGIELEDVAFDSNVVVFTKNNEHFFTKKSQLTNSSQSVIQNESKIPDELKEIAASIDAMPKRANFSASPTNTAFDRLSHYQIFLIKVRECKDQAAALGNKMYLVTCLQDEVRAYEELRKMSQSATIREPQAWAMCEGMAAPSNFPNYAVWLKCMKAVPDMCTGDYPSCLRAIQSGMWALRQGRQ